MSLSIDHLQRFVIAPVLWTLHDLTDSTKNFYSYGAIKFLVRIAGAESDLVYLRQHRNGPARGLWQMEPATMIDVFEHVVERHPDIKRVVMSMLPADFDCRSEAAADRLMTDLAFGCVMARLQLWRFPAALPAHYDVEGQYRYYKRYYNSALGKATLAKWLAKNPLPETSEPDHANNS